MNDCIVETVSRNAAAALTRRASLLAIGGAAVAAAMSRPSLARPGASGKSARKRCQKQTSQCRAAIADYCAPLELPQVCKAFLSPCCDTLGQCNAGLTVTCLLSVVAS